MTTINLEIKNKIGYIILNKPKANGYDIQFMQLLASKIDEAILNNEIKIIAIKSALPKFFCAGADIKIFEQNTTVENKKMVSYANAVSEKLSQSPKITVALLNGHTLGGGLELALACDIRLASDAEFLIGMSEVNLGLMPGNGGTQRLIRLINHSKALELLITGEAIMSDYALEIGLVNQLYTENEFKKLSTMYLEKLASGPLSAMKCIKKAVNKGIELTLEKGLKLESELADSLYDTTDATEGLNAFIQKRKPNFK